jgi:hypothetical protein
MADKRKAQTPDSGKRSRAPTIDLTATEVTSPASETPPSVAPVSEAVPAEPQVEQGSAEPIADPASAETSASESPAAEQGATESAPPQEPPIAEPPPASETPPPRPSTALPFAAGFLGGIIPAAVLAGLWYGGVLPGPRSTDLQQRIGAIEQQVSAVRKDIQSLQTQAKALPASGTGPQNTSAPAVDAKAFNDLKQRVTKLETSLQNLPANAAPDPQLANRIAANENALKSNDAALAELNNLAEQASSSGTQALRQTEALNTAVNQLGARVDDLARQRPDGVTPAQFEELKKQVAAVEQATQAARKDIQANAAAASASRLALAATILRNAVLSHASYQSELARAQALGADAKQLAPLQRFASTGVPSDAQLADQLRKILPTLTQAAAPQDTSGTFLDRLRANAGRLVRVTPADAPRGDDAADVLARLLSEANHNDIDGALRDVQKLPQDAQAKAADWMATVKARSDALAAARGLASEAANALGK